MHELDVNAENCYGTSLHSAVATGSLDRVKDLLDEGVDANCKNEDKLLNI